MQHPVSVTNPPQKKKHQVQLHLVCHKEILQKAARTQLSQGRRASIICGDGRIFLNPQKAQGSSGGAIRSELRVNLTQMSIVPLCSQIMSNCSLRRTKLSCKEDLTLKIVRKLASLPKKSPNLSSLNWKDEREICFGLSGTSHSPELLCPDGLVFSVSILVMCLQSLGRQTLSRGHPASGPTVLLLL